MLHFCEGSCPGEIPWGGRESQGSEPKAGFTCERGGQMGSSQVRLLLSPSLSPLSRFLGPQKPNRKWGGLSATHFHHQGNRVGLGMGEVLALKEIQSFDHYRSFIGLR